jgi:hypothetical protein
MFHSTFTKKTTALAREREAFEEERESWRKENAENAEILDRIRSNPEWNAAWQHLMEHGVSKRVEQNGEAGDGDPDDLLDRRTAERLIEERVAARLKEREERNAQQEREYQEKAASIGQSIRRFMEDQKVDKDTARGYWTALDQKLPTDTDAVIHYTPAGLYEALVDLHEKAQLRAEVETLKKQVAQRASKDARTTKQSQTPPRRETTRHRETAAQKLERQLGIEPDWSNVTGMGFGQ